LKRHKICKICKMLKHKCKKCRRQGSKLFLKGERCLTSKCAVARKPYVPGSAPKSGGRRKAVSEYSTKLKENQKNKFGYALRGTQYKNYMKEAMEKAGGGDVKNKLFEILESRLDNVVFRMGFAPSRFAAKQMVGHGHITVNDRKTDIPSRRIKIGDKIAIRSQSADRGIFKDLDIKLKKQEAPAWIKMDKDKKEGIIVGAPLHGDVA